MLSRIASMLGIAAALSIPTPNSSRWNSDRAPAATSKGKALRAERKRKAKIAAASRRRNRR